MEEQETFPGERVTALLRPIADIREKSGQIVGGALAGSRCGSCGAGAFPARDTCMACGGRDLATEALPACGTLYSFTTIHVSSSRPTPYTIGYVDLEGGIRLLATLGAVPDTLHPDMPVRLEIDGDQWSFVPAGDR